METIKQFLSTSMKGSMMPDLLAFIIMMLLFFAFCSVLILVSLSSLWLAGSILGFINGLQLTSFFIGAAAGIGFFHFYDKL